MRHFGNGGNEVNLPTNTLELYLQVIISTGDCVIVVKVLISIFPLKSMWFLMLAILDVNVSANDR